MLIRKIQKYLPVACRHRVFAGADVITQRRVEQVIGLGICRAVEPTGAEPAYIVTVGGVGYMLRPNLPG